MAVGSDDFSTRPAPIDGISKGAFGGFVEFPIFVGFLKAYDGRIKLTVEIEGGAEFGQGGRMESVDIVGDYTYVRAG